jgi:hypothetical protein
MTKRIPLAILCLGALLLFSCSRHAGGDGPNGVVTDTLKEVSVHTEQAVYAAGETEIDIVLYNDGDVPWRFDVSYSLQALGADGWEDVSKGDKIVWIEMSYSLGPRQTAEQSLALTVYVDAIPPGQYRIVKPVYSEDGEREHHLTAVFTVTP